MRERFGNLSVTHYSLRNSFKRTFKFLIKLFARKIRGPFVEKYDNPFAGDAILCFRTNVFARPAPKQVTLYRCGCDFFAHHYTNGKGLRGWAHAHSKHALNGHRLRWSLGVADTRGGGMHTYAVRRALPFARRLFITPRPVALAMRLRNPCVRLRFFIL